MNSTVSMSSNTFENFIKQKTASSQKSAHILYFKSVQVIFLISEWSLTRTLFAILDCASIYCVAIFQSDHFVFSTNLLFKFNVSLPLVTGELLQNTVDVNNVTYKHTLLTSTVF